MSSNSLDEQSENFIDKSFEEYKKEASILNEETNNSTQIPKKKKLKKIKKKKEMTKDDVIDQMRDLNGKLRDKLKELNSRMERVLENIKYKIIHSKHHY